MSLVHHAWSGDRQWAKADSCHKREHHPSTYSTVDGTDALFTTGRYWDEGSKYLCWDTVTWICRNEKLLMAEQKDESNIHLECYKFPKRRITQVPYHKDLDPFWISFGEKIEGADDLESFTIRNFHLPPGFVSKNIIPVFDNNITVMHTLEISNCSIGSDGVAEIVKFLNRNATLETIDLAGSTLDAETTLSLSRAIKSHPMLNHVGLARCELGNGDVRALNKLLFASKDLASLSLGHSSFSSECVALVAKFLGKRISIKTFSLDGAKVDKEGKKLLSHALRKNRSITDLTLHNNSLKLPFMQKNSLESMDRLTFLDLSFNSFPSQGASVMAEFLRTNTTLIELVLSNNHMTTASAKKLLPALKENSTLQHLDLSNNWFNDDSTSPIIIDVLRGNSSLFTLDLSGNKSMKANHGGRYLGWDFENRCSKRSPVVDGSRMLIIKGALFDTSSLQAVANSNHKCTVKMSSRNKNNSHELTIAAINELDDEGLKVRLKVVLALTEVNKDLNDLRFFDSIPLELMPRLLELVQQELGYDGFGEGIVPNRNRESRHWTYDRSKRSYKIVVRYHDPRLRKLYDIIHGSNAQLLCQRGPGLLKLKAARKPVSKKKKRKQLGDSSDTNDEEWKPHRPVKLNRPHWV